MSALQRRRWLLQGGMLGILLFALVVGSQFVSATFGEGGLQPPRITVEAAPEQDRERVTIVDTIPVVRLSGTPYEIGLQHGRLLRPQIDFLRREYFEAMVVPMVGLDNLKQWATEVEPHLPEHFRQELQGLAAGAGLKYGDALVMNSMVDRMQGVMCSTVVAAGDASRDGEVYFGRNLDFPGRNLLQRMSVVFVLEPKDGPKLVHVGWPGVLGVLSGMNEHGIAGATMMIHDPTSGATPGLPYMLMYREALSRARKVADVFAFIEKTKRTCPNNFMVVDPEGNAEVVEFDAEVAARRTAVDGTLCATNHFLTDRLSDVGWPVGVKRYRSLAAFLEAERGSIDLDAVRRALKDVATPWYLNVQSMIFLPARRELHLSVGGKLPAAAQRFVHLDKKTLFGADGPER